MPQQAFFFATGKLQISLKNLASGFLPHGNSKQLIGVKNVKEKFPEISNTKPQHTACVCELLLH
jgi:hypothetical protein